MKSSTLIELNQEVPELEIEPEADYTTLSTVGRQVLWAVINLDDKANTRAEENY